MPFAFDSNALISVFLLHLLIVIAILLWEVLLPPENSLLVVPCKMVLQRVLPSVYTAEKDVVFPPYFASGLLFVSVTTLVLFFASGMYSEKIGYANKYVGIIPISVFHCSWSCSRYVPHANRALRSFNMYLNVRRPPLRSKFYWNPIKFFFPRPAEVSPTASRSSSRSTSPEARARSASTSRPIPTIPPAANPRGELIFSSKVDKSFREGYERHRATFERKREEKERAEMRKTWLGRMAFWDREGSPTTPPASVTPTAPSRTASVSSSKGKGGGNSRSGTPPTTSAGGIVMKPRDRSRSPRSGDKRDGTPPRRERGSRRDKDSGSEADMRTVALERSFGQDQVNRGSRLPVE